MVSTPDPDPQESPRQGCRAINPCRPPLPADCAAASQPPSMDPRGVAVAHEAAENLARPPTPAGTRQTVVNLDWLRDPPPASITAFQRLVRSVNWKNSSIGPVVAWPRELKQMVRLIVADPCPKVVYWGPRYTVIYNEACVPLLGAKHPNMMGRDAPEVFSEFWASFDGLLANQRSTGETFVGEASMLLMDRHGFLEETYFDWKLTPIISDEGAVLGTYACPSDLTRDVIAMRRTDCIKGLAHQTPNAASSKDLWQATLSSLVENEKDLPLVLLYSVEEQSSLASASSRPHFTCHLVGSNGVQPDHPMARECINSRHDVDGLASEVFRALEKDEIHMLKVSDPRLRGLIDGIEWRGYGLPSYELAIVPVRVDGTAAALLLVGLNPYRRFNEAYHEFLHIIGEVIGPQITKIRLSEEVLRRAEAARKATSDFQKSELRFDKFAKRSSVGLAVASADRKLVYANDAWYEFSGMDASVKSYDYDDWLSTVYEEDRPLVLERWTKIIAEKKEGRFQYRSKVPFQQGHMHSKNRTAICTVHPDLNEARDVESIMVLVMDISELKWIEEQLRIRTKALEESEGKYRNYAEHCPLGIVRTDGEGYVQYGNDAWHNHYGFKEGEMSGPEPWLSHLDDEYMEAWKNFFQRFQEDQGPRAIELRLKNRVYTMQDGQHTIEHDVYYLVTGYSEFKEDGTVDYIDLWVTGDISPQKMTAKVLADKMDEAIRLRNHQERFIDMISHEIRNPLSAVLHCSEEILEALKTCLDEIGALAAVLPPETIYAKTTSDLSVRVKNALEASNTIMYCVQHQKQIVDDVLTLSKLDADLLVVSPVPVEPMKLLRSAFKVFQPELRMTDITLSITEDPSVSDLGLSWILLDPNRFLQVVINLVTNSIKFTRTAKTRHIDITVAAYDKPPADHTLGVQFVPRRYESAKLPSPTGEISEGFQVWEDVYLSFSVKDSGRGLTKDEMARLFNRFTQASPKTHVEYGGSGLGLFISRQITEMLGGEIGMSSDGVGSTFAFYAKASKVSPPRRPSVSIEPIIQLTRSLSLTSTASPLVVPPEEKNGPAIDVKLVAPESLPRSNVLERHILVVEDNLVNQKILCKLLRNRNFVVDAANHGREALDAIRKLGSTGLGQVYDAILCDIEMPVMGGIEFAKQVRSQEASGEMLGHVPIIGVTANVRSQQVSAAIEAGMDGVTTKPYRIDELIAHMGRVCSVAADRVLN